MITEPLPTHDGLVEELRDLRERGMAGIRDARVPELITAARLAGYEPAAAGVATAVEQLVRKAVESLGDGVLGRAAGFTFGTSPGYRERPAHKRRERASEEYQVSTERFRRAQERQVISQVADGVLRLARRVTTEPSSGDLPAAWTIPLRHHGTTATVTLLVGPIELLRGIDIVVTSINVHFELPHLFSPSLAGALRAAAAVRDEDTGGIVDDVIARELDTQLDRANARGLAAAPGFVRVTSSGRLAEHGIQRLFHAGVATPRPGSVRYGVDPGAIQTAMRNTFRIAARLRATELHDLRSISFPLFGVGCGAIERQQSLRWMLAALERELPAHPPWKIYLLSRTGHAIDLANWTRADPHAG